MTPLEIWDLLTSAGPLHQCRHLPEYPCLLVEALEALRRQLAFEAVVVAGGGSLELGVRATLPTHFGGTVFFAPDPVFAAQAGGTMILRHLGKSGLIVDVGQTAIKVMHGEERRLFPRNWEALPTTDRGRPQQRLALRHFTAPALRSQNQPRPEAVVLALPCDFPDGVPGACSYAGLEGDCYFVEAVLEEAGLADVPCVYLNDAVLTALSARVLFGRQLPARTLVATLGFGVGGALLEGGPCDAL